MKILIGKKIGMTQIFNDNGSVSVSTAFDVSNNAVSKLFKDSDKVTHIEISKDKKLKNVTKADSGNYKELGFVPRQKRVFKVDSNEAVLESGTALDVSIFEIGDIVDVSGRTKGKGFQGVVKRWGFKGGPKTHGQSDRQRAPGSIGERMTPGRVFKGQKMPGHMGFRNKTIKRLKVVGVDKENGVILINGSVPGPKGAYLVIKESYFNKLKKK